MSTGAPCIQVVVNNTSTDYANASIASSVCNSRDGSGTDVYAREAAQKELLLGHVLVVALAAEGWRMAPEQYDALRKELKMASADVVQR